MISNSCKYTSRESNGLMSSRRHCSAHTVLVATQMDKTAVVYHGNGGGQSKGGGKGGGQSEGGGIWIVSRASPYPPHYCCCAIMRNSSNTEGRGWLVRLVSGGALPCNLHSHLWFPELTKSWNFQCE